MSIKCMTNTKIFLSTILSINVSTLKPWWFGFIYLCFSSMYCPGVKWSVIWMFQSKKCYIPLFAGLTLLDQEAECCKNHWSRDSGKENRILFPGKVWSCGTLKVLVHSALRLFSLEHWCLEGQYTLQAFGATVIPILGDYLMDQQKSGGCS